MGFKLWIIIEILVLCLSEEIEQLQLNPSTLEIRKSANYYISIRNPSPIPQNGKIKVSFPSEFQPLNSDSSSCSVIYNIDPQATCEFEGNTVYIIDGFPESHEGGSVSFIVNSVPNPDFASESGSFEIFTLDETDSVIDSKTDGLTLKFEPKPLKTFEINPESSISGRETTWILEFEVEYAIPEGGSVIVSFPKWNEHLEGSENYLESFIQSSPTCRPFSCTFENDQLTVSISDETVGLVSLEVEPARNPPTTQGVSGFKLVTLAPNGSLEESSDLTVTVKVDEPGSLVNAFFRFDRGNSKVNSQEIYKFSMETSNPVPEGSYIEVTFPQEVALENYLTRVTGIFGFENNNPEFEVEGTSVRINYGFSRYKTGPSYLEFKFDSCKNPPTSEPTSSIKIAVYDKNNYIIDKVQNGLGVTSTPGTVENILVDPKDSQIEIETNYTISFYSNEPLTEGSAIFFTFPPQVQAKDRPESACAEVKGLGESATCEVLNNQLFVRKVFLSGTAQQEIELVLDQVTNPMTTQTTEDFEVKLYSSDDFEYLISEGTGGRFAATPEKFKSVEIEPSSFVTGELNRYYFTLESTNTIPREGKVVVVFPAEIRVLPDIAVCGDWEGFQSSAYCLIAEDSISIIDGFKTSAFAPGTLKFSVSGVKNPGSTRPSSSFAVQSESSQGDFVNYQDQNLSVEMKYPNELGGAEVVASSLQVGAETQLTISVTPKNPFPSGGYIHVTPPEEVAFSGENTCGVSGTLAKSAVCEVIEGVLRATLTFENSEVNEEFSFVVNKFQNPSSSKPTGSFALSSKTSEFEIDYLDTNLVLEMQEPAPMVSGTLSLEDYGINTYTSYLFEFETAFETPKGSCLEVSFPPEVSLDSLTGCKVDGEQLFCSKLSSDTLELEMFPQRTEPKKFLVEVGSVKNPPNTEQYESFSLTTKTSEKYLLESYSEIKVEFVCYEPCATCLNTPENCLSCIKTSSTPYFFEGECLRDCPEGTIDLGDTECVSCNEKCKTCSNSVDKCTSCVKNGNYPYFYENDCVEVCPSNFFVTTEFECSQCDESCKTCEGSSENCTSCFAPLVLYNSECIAECPSKTTEVDQECLECNQECLECESSTDRCTSCESGRIFFDDFCYDECPGGTSIPLNGTCEKCSSPCKTCSETVTNCNSCVEDYFLYENSCVPSCQPGFIGLNGVCEACSEECLECSGSKDNCTKCKEGYLIFSGRCLESCPPNISIRSGNECLECLGKCLTCSGTIETCTSCYSGTYLYDNLCLEECPSGTLPLSGECENCDPSCASCEGSKSNCTSCAPNFYDFKGKCRRRCPEGYFGASGECEPCEAPCLDCYDEATSCSSCLEGYLLFEAKCLAECPLGYQASGDVCVEIENFECAPGCSRTKLSNSVCDEECNNQECDFDNQVCQEDTVVEIAESISYAKSLPLEQEPFLVSGFGVLGGGVAVLGSVFWGASLIPSTIAVFGVIETGGWIGLTAQVYSADSTKGRELLMTGEGRVEFIFSGFVALLIIHYTINLACFWFYWKYVREKDTVHKDWTETNVYFAGSVATLSVLASFKCLRLVFCQLVKLEPARFERWSNILKPLIYISYFSLGLVSIPLVVLQIYTMTVFTTGNVVFLLSLDCLVITSVQTGLLVVETKKMWEVLAREENFYSLELLKVSVGSKLQNRSTLTELKSSFVEGGEVVKNYLRNLKKLNEERSKLYLERTQSLEHLEETQQNRSRSYSDPGRYTDGATLKVPFKDTKKEDTYLSSRLELDEPEIVEDNTFDEIESFKEVDQCFRPTDSVVTLKRGFIQEILNEESRPNFRLIRNKSQGRPFRGVSILDLENRAQGICRTRPGTSKPSHNFESIGVQETALESIKQREVTEETTRKPKAADDKDWKFRRIHKTILFKRSKPPTSRRKTPLRNYNFIGKVFPTSLFVEDSRNNSIPTIHQKSMNSTRELFNSSLEDFKNAEFSLESTSKFQDRNGKSTSSFS